MPEINLNPTPCPRDEKLEQCIAPWSNETPPAPGILCFANRRVCRSRNVVKRPTSRSRHVESVLRTLSSLLSLLSATLGHIQSARFEVLFRHQILDTRINSVEKLQTLRKIGLLAESGRSVHQNHLLRLAMEGAQTTVYHLRDFEAETSSCDLDCILDRHGDTEARLTG